MNPRSPPPSPLRIHASGRIASFSGSLRSSSPRRRPGFSRHDAGRTDRMQRCHPLPGAGPLPEAPRSSSSPLAARQRARQIQSVLKYRRLRKNPAIRQTTISSGRHRLNVHCRRRHASARVPWLPVRELGRSSLSVTLARRAGAERRLHSGFNL